VFQRLHGRQEYEGTGIGLSICKRIVERHKGSIIAKSAPGKGARFIVTLPVVTEEDMTTETDNRQDTLEMQNGAS
jgi:signal transduction histidine kinase